MEEKNYSPISLEGEVFYRNITSINFSPVKKIKTFKPKVLKGKLYFWRLLGFIPLIPLVAKQDLYKSDYREDMLHRFCSLEDAYRYEFQEYGTFFLKGNDAYLKAVISINSFEKKLNETKYFDDNESALQYLNDLKFRCKEVGNILK